MRNVYSVREKILFTDRRGCQSVITAFNRGKVYGDLAKLRLPDKYLKLCPTAQILNENQEFGQIKCVFDTFEQAYSFFEEAGFYSVEAKETLLRHRKTLVFEGIYRLTKRNFSSITWIEEYHLNNASTFSDLSKDLSCNDFILFCRDKGLISGVDKAQLLNE